MRERKIGVLKPQLWKHATFIIAPTIDGANVARNPNCVASKGGVFMAIFPILVKSITYKGILASALGVWIHTDHQSLGIFGILVVYVSTNPTSHVHLWMEII